MDCGKVRVQQGKDIEHTPYCKSKRTAQKPKIESVFLYRQLESEAIRVLMPFADIGLAEKRASFKAALELGFRRHFQGDPVHLQMKEAREPVAGGGYRQYLVIFDTVPGGTGYLSELWRSANFMDVLQLALTSLQSCECQKQEGKDGCYRCLYAYQRQRELELISSRLAQEVLTQILSKASELKDIQTLSEVSLDSRLESELEEKFIAALAERAKEQKNCAWREIVQGGEVRWKLNIEGREWEIQAQKLLGSVEGVTVGSKPDFLFRRLDGNPGQKPIAVFCDGFAYHGCPGKAEGRIWDDVVKRRSIIESGKHQKWSVAWKDVELFEKGKGKGPSLFEGATNRQVNRLASANGLTLSTEVGKASNMEMLWAYLADPDVDQWSQMANAWSVGWLASDPLMNPEEIDGLEQKLLSEETLVAPGEIGKVAGVGTRIGRVEWGDYVQMLTFCNAADLQAGNIDAASVVLRLDDSSQNREANDFEAYWRSFLQAWNLLQFRDNVEVQTSERIRFAEDLGDADLGFQVAAETELPDYADTDAVLLELMEYSPETVKPFLQYAASRGLSLPTIDFELDLGDGRCGPQPELAWPSLKIAVLADNQIEDAEALEARSWAVFRHPIDNEAIAGEVRARSAEIANEG
jgi:DEAD/DEAH box helicase domain-containing protein